MKVEELHTADNESQIGVVFQRIPFETRIDMFPQLNPLIESADCGSGEDVSTTSELASEKTQNQLSRAVKNQEGGSELQANPVKDIFSGQGIPLSHVQESSTTEELGETTPMTSKNAQELLDEIDSADDKKCDKGKPAKSNTLTRLLKGIRGEKAEERAEKKTNSGAINKIFQKVNPVNKASRENISKVLNRIGDVLHRKADEDCELSACETKGKSLDLNTKEKQSKSSENTSRFGKFGVFKSRNTD